MFKIIITFNRIYSYIYQHILVFSINTGILFTQYILSLVMSILLSLVLYCHVIVIVNVCISVIFIVISRIIINIFTRRGLQKKTKKQLNDSLSVTTR